MNPNEWANFPQSWTTAATTMYTPVSTEGGVSEYASVRELIAEFTDSPLGYPFEEEEFEPNYTMGMIARGAATREDKML